MTPCYKVGLPEEVTSELRPEGKEGAQQAQIWRKCILGRGTSKCKGPEAGTTLAKGTSRKACVAAAELRGEQPKTGHKRTHVTTR